VPHVPPAPQVYALGVHLFDGDPAKDEKIPGATLTLQERTERTDGAGNAAFVNLTAGTYEVCATAEGFVRGCATAPLPGPDVNLELARDVPPTVPLTTSGRIFLQAGQPWRWKGVSAFGNCSTAGRTAKTSSRLPARLQGLQRAAGVALHAAEGLGRPRVGCAIGRADRARVPRSRRARRLVCRADAADR
jgi:hypothetical protein